MKSKRGQASTEYLIIMGFVIFLLMAVLSVGFLYTSQISDSLRVYQAQNFANKIIGSAENVYYSGQPSQMTIDAYLPSGVTALEVFNDTLIMNISAHGGTSRISFPSEVNLTGSLSPSGGLKKLSIVAEMGFVNISEVS